jgi:hypothetical protein
MTGLILGAVIVGCNQPSVPEWYSYNFDAFPDGTEITSDREGLKWVQLAGNEFVDWGFEISSSPSSYCVTVWLNLGEVYLSLPDSNYLATNFGAGLSCAGNQKIEITFLDPVMGVELEFVGTSEVYRMEVYDAKGTLLGFSTAQADIEAPDPFSILLQSEQSEIHRVVFGVTGSDLALVAISEIRVLQE